jgi:ketosteroid isomerase-like protein
MTTLACLSVFLMGAAAAAPAQLSEAERHEIARTLEGLERQWFQVYESHDLSALPLLIADDFVATLADGAMRGKSEHIAAYPADFEAFSSVTSGDLRVRVFARDVAVVTGLYTATLRGKAVPAAVARYRYTDTWLRRKGAWQCVATHESPLQ